MTAIAAPAGRITTMTVGRVGYGLSRELREKSEAELSAQAIARYRARAADIANSSGYAGYTLREVNVANCRAERPTAHAAGPRDGRADGRRGVAGRGGRQDRVSVTVSGSVQLTK